jgi:hypothetical protein
MLEYLPMSEFPLRWRFGVDATRWTVLPEGDLQQFRPLSAECSRKLWNQHVTPAAAHLMTADVAGLWLNHRIAQYRSADERSEAEQATHAVAFLREHLPLREEAKLLFF